MLFLRCRYWCLFIMAAVVCQMSWMYTDNGYCCQMLWFLYIFYYGCRYFLHIFLLWLLFFLSLRCREWCLYSYNSCCVSQMPLVMSSYYDYYILYTASDMFTMALALSQMSWVTSIYYTHMATALSPKQPGTCFYNGCCSFPGAASSVSLLKRYSSFFEFDRQGTASCIHTYKHF